MVSALLHYRSAEIHHRIVTAGRAPELQVSASIEALVLLAQEYASLFLADTNAVCTPVPTSMVCLTHQRSIQLMLLNVSLSPLHSAQ
jgi:hypothetical protein